MSGHRHSGRVSGDFDDLVARDSSATKELQAALPERDTQRTANDDGNGTATSENTTVKVGDGPVSANDEMAVAARQGRAAAEAFLTSLTHDQDPKTREREKLWDDASSEATVDDIEFAKFKPAELEARSQTFHDISAGVTDDEFNALFGPTE